MSEIESRKLPSEKREVSIDSFIVHDFDSGKITLRCAKCECEQFASNLCGEIAFTADQLIDMVYK